MVATSLVSVMVGGTRGTVALLLLLLIFFSILFYRNGRSHIHFVTPNPGDYVKHQPTFALQNQVQEPHCISKPPAAAQTP